MRHKSNLFIEDLWRIYGGYNKVHAGLPTQNIMTVLK